jgi:ketosteroid isomerase-like protein
MKKIRSLTAGALACAALLLTATQSFAEEADASFKATLEKSGKAAQDGIASGDMSAYADFYADDAWVFPPNEPASKGKAAIKAAWQAMADSGAVKGLSWWATRTEVIGHAGVEYGDWVVKGADGKVLDQGTFLAVWKHTADGWKMIADTWNSSTPLPAAM